MGSGLSAGGAHPRAPIPDTTVFDLRASQRGYRLNKMCGSLCLQHKVNEVLDAHQKGLVQLRRPEGAPPQHLSFI